MFSFVLKLNTWKKNSHSGSSASVFLKMQKQWLRQANLNDFWRGWKRSWELWTFCQIFHFPLPRDTGLQKKTFEDFLIPSFYRFTVGLETWSLINGPHWTKRDTRATAIWILQKKYEYGEINWIMDHHAVSNVCCQQVVIFSAAVSVVQVLFHIK